MAVAVRRGVRVHWDARERFPAPQRQAALQKVVYSQGQQPLAEPELLQAAKRELQGEWVSERQAQRASGLRERLQGPVLAPWEQFSEQQAQQPEASLGESQELRVWGQWQARPEPELTASERREPREPAAVPLPARLVSTAQLSLQRPSIPSPLWRLLPLEPRLPLLLECSGELSPQRQRESNSNASFFQ